MSTTKKITREEWLTQAVYVLDDTMFRGILNSHTTSFQIACAKCSGKKQSECILSEDGSFPPTITIDYRLQDSEKVLMALSRECINAFLNKPKGKYLTKICKAFGFEKPYSECHLNQAAMDIINIILEKMIDMCGMFPNIAIIPKTKKQKKTTDRLICFCPDCGFQFVVTKKMLDQHNNCIPTCGCGAKMRVKSKDTTIELDLPDSSKEIETDEYFPTNKTIINKHSKNNNPPHHKQKNKTQSVFIDDNENYFYQYGNFISPPTHVPPEILKIVQQRMESYAKESLDSGNPPKEGMINHETESDINET